MKLHLGCGEKKIPGFINVDIRPDVNPDIIDNISNLSQFEDGSVDLIYCCHVLEHFGRHDYYKVLQTWTKKLKKGGKLRLSVPDLDVAIKLIYEKKYPLKKIIGLFYGGQTYKENYHYMGFNYDILENDLKELGYSKIYKWDWRKTEHSNIDDYSQAYLPHMDKENGTQVSLNIEAKK
jgi:predicted SAM-dependent methyltransferase